MQAWRNLSAQKLAAVDISSSRQASFHSEFLGV